MLELCNPQKRKRGLLLSSQIAKYTMLAFLILCILILASMGILHWHWNRSRDLQDKHDRDSEYYTTHPALRRY